MVLVQLDATTGNFVGSYQSSSIDNDERLSLVSISNDNASVYSTASIISDERCLCQWNITGSTNFICFNIPQSTGALVPRGVQAYDAFKVMMTIQFYNNTVEVRNFDFGNPAAPNIWTKRFGVSSMNPNNENNVLHLDMNTDKLYCLVHAHSKYLFFTLTISTGAVTNKR